MSNEGMIVVLDNRTPIRLADHDMIGLAALLALALHLAQSRRRGLCMAAPLIGCSLPVLPNNGTILIGSGLTRSGLPGSDDVATPIFCTLLRRPGPFFRRTLLGRTSLFLRCALLSCPRLFLRRPLLRCPCLFLCRALLRCPRLFLR